MDNWVDEWNRNREKDERKEMGRGRGGVFYKA